MSTPPPTDALTTGEVARLLNVQPSTVRSWHARGQMPGRDGEFAGRPWWRPATIVAWRAARPGTGARTDLRRAEG